MRFVLYRIYDTADSDVAIVYQGEHPSRDDCYNHVIKRLQHERTTTERDDVNRYRRGVHTNYQRMYAVFSSARLLADTKTHTVHEVPFSHFVQESLDCSAHYDMGLGDSDACDWRLDTVEDFNQYVGITE